MKKIASFVLFLSFLICFENMVYSQAKKFRFTKVTHDVKKEVKKFEKQGFSCFPGMLPLSQQLNESYKKQVETDENGFPMYITASGSSVAQSQTAAEMQATEVAKQRLVGLVQTNMKSVVETQTANNQLDAKDAASITKTIEVATNKVSKKLGRVIVLYKILRPVNNNTEVQILIGYNMAMATKAMIDEMKIELQNETEDIRAKYEQFLNPELYKSGEIVNVAE